MMRRGTLCMLVAVLCWAGLPAAGLADLQLQDAWCSLETTGSAGEIDGNIYINTNGLVFHFAAEVSGYDDQDEAWFRYSPVDGEGGWYDINSNAVPITTNGTMIEGTVDLDGLELTVRHEFVVKYQPAVGDTIWLTPFTHSVGTNGVASYDLGPDAAHPAEDDLYNGFFIPLDPPHVVIDYPTEGEIITSPIYTIRTSANASANNVRVKIDNEDWSQCYFSVEHWWFDWGDYAAGPHVMIAETWNILGQRFETPVRNCTYQPSAEFGNLLDAWSELVTTDESGVDEGDIYTNPDDLTFWFKADAADFNTNATALLHITSNGWTDIDSIVIPIDTNGVTSNGVLIEGAIALGEVDILVRHEFVVEYQDGISAQVWLKPFTYWGTNGVISYDLGPDEAHQNPDDTFNGFFTPIERPFVVIDFPYEDEVIPGPEYEIRNGANGSANNVRVKIDTGDWSQCYYSVGYWWFDWGDYAAGPHVMIAEAWNILEQRYETPVRHCVYQPGPWIDPDPAVAGEDVTVYYNSLGRPLEGVSPIYLHYGFNGWNGDVGVADAMMTTNGSVWQATVVVASVAQQLDVAFWDGGVIWDDNDGADWHFTVTGGWNLDGDLDASATMVSSNGGLHLYAGVVGDDLYVAVEDAGEGNDHFIFLANPPGALVPAPWTKAGQVAQWSAYLADENDSDFEGWFDLTTNGIAMSASGLGDGYLEGTIDLVGQFGSMPTEAYLAMGPYESPDDGALLYEYQVPPTINSNGAIDAAEYIAVNICDLRVRHRPTDFDKDCSIDLDDYVLFEQCMDGPGNPAAGTCPDGVDADLDDDGDVDLFDFAVFQEDFGGVY